MGRVGAQLAELEVLPIGLAFASSYLVSFPSHFAEKVGTRARGSLQLTLPRFPKELLLLFPCCYFGVF